MSISTFPAVQIEFQSTPPARGATLLVLISFAVGAISIHAPREGGDTCAYRVVELLEISIHAPREGGDAGTSGGRRVGAISIHAPREGGDWAEGQMETERTDISIHAPREGGDGLSFTLHSPIWAISIHAPREGGDYMGRKRGSI